MKKQKYIWVIIKHPKDKRGHAERIPNSIETMMEIVGGDLELLTVAENLVIICNADGVENGEKYNCDVMGVPITGTLIVAGVRGEEIINTPITVPQWERHWMTYNGAQAERMDRNE